MNSYQKYRAWLTDENNCKWISENYGSKETNDFVGNHFPDMDPYYAYHIMKHVLHGVTPPMFSPDEHTNVIASYVRGLLPEQGKMAKNMGHINLEEDLWN